MTATLPAHHAAPPFLWPASQHIAAHCFPLAMPSIPASFISSILSGGLQKVTALARPCFSVLSHSCTASNSSTVRRFLSISSLIARALSSGRCLALLPSFPRRVLFFFRIRDRRKDTCYNGIALDGIPVHIVDPLAGTISPVPAFLLAKKKKRGLGKIPGLSFSLAGYVDTVL